MGRLADIGKVAEIGDRLPGRLQVGCAFPLQAQPKCLLNHLIFTCFGYLIAYGAWL